MAGGACSFEPVGASHVFDVNRITPLRVEDSRVTSLEFRDGGGECFEPRFAGLYLLPLVFDLPAYGLCYIF